MKKPPSARSRKIAYIVIAVLYGALITMNVVSGDLVFAALFLMIGLVLNWDALNAWYRRRMHPATDDAGVQ